MYGPLMRYGPLTEEETMTAQTPTLSLTQGEHEAVLRLWDFSRILIAAGLLDDDQVGYFLEKPWKWEREHALWQAAGRPSPSDEPIGERTLDGMRWERFVNNAANPD